MMDFNEAQDDEEPLPARRHQPSCEERLRRLGETLNALTPEQLEQAISVTAKLLAIKAKKRAEAKG